MRKSSKKNILAQIYELIKDDANFPSSPWYARKTENTYKSLKEILRSENLDIIRLAAKSLSTASYFHGRNVIEEIWIADKFCELVKNKKDIWLLGYIEGMALCRLNWVKNCGESLQGYKGSEHRRVINRMVSSYCCCWLL